MVVCYFVTFCIAVVVCIVCITATAIGVIGGAVIIGVIIIVIVVIIIIVVVIIVVIIVIAADRALRHYQSGDDIKKYTRTEAAHCYSPDDPNKCRIDMKVLGDTAAHTHDLFISVTPN